MNDKEYRRARIQHRSASRLYLPRHRLWNWFFNTEYTALGPPPFAWAILLAVAVTFTIITLIIVL